MRLGEERCISIKCILAEDLEFSLLLERKTDSLSESDIFKPCVTEPARVQWFLLLCTHHRGHWLSFPHPSSTQRSLEVRLPLRMSSVTWLKRFLPNLVNQSLKRTFVEGLCCWTSHAHCKQELGSHFSAVFLFLETVERVSWRISVLMLLWEPS